MGGEPIEVRRQPFYTRVANMGFRIGLLVDEMGEPTQLGHLPRELYSCPAMGPKNDMTCMSDGFMAVECALAGGVYQGDGSMCAGVVCVARGACCFGDGSCADAQTNDECTAAGGAVEACAPYSTSYCCCCCC